MRNLRLIADELIKKIYLFFGRKINAGYEFELAFRGAQSHCCYEGETLWKHPTAIYSPAESARRIDKYWVRQSTIFGNTLRCDTRTPHIPSVRFNANSTNDISIWLPWFCVSVGGGGSWYKTSGEAQNECGCADRSLCYRTNEVRELFFSLYFQCCRQLINANTLDFISSFALCWIHSCVAICPVRWPKTHISRIVEAFSCVALA